MHDDQPFWQAQFTRIGVPLLITFGIVGGATQAEEDFTEFRLPVIWISGRVVALRGKQWHLDSKGYELVFV